MTNVRPIVAALLGLAFAPVAVAGAADPVVPAPAVQIGPDVSGQFQLPDDAKYYSDLGSIFQRPPTLGPSGSFDWFVNRTRAADDARAIGVASGDASGGSTQLAFGSIPGTVELRSGVLPTAAVAVDGRTWILDDATTPRPARTVLRALRDGSTPKTVRLRSGFRPSAAIATDRGVRIVGSVVVRRGKSRSTQVAITGPGSTKPVPQPLVRNYSTVAALAGGRLVFGGRSYADYEAIPDPITIVAANGTAKRAPGRRVPSAASFSGHAGIAVIRSGFVVDEGSQIPTTADLDKSAVVLRSATSGKVLVRRKLASLDFPKNPLCTTPTSYFVALRLATGPDGMPVLTLGCGNTRFYRESPTSLVYETTLRDQTVTVGLDSELNARWWRPASELGPAPVGAYRVSEACNSFVTAPDGRLASFGCNGNYNLISVPGVGTPKPGKLGAVKRSGKSGALVRITCGGDVGKVCSGTVTVTVGGVPVGSAKYALPARPGAARGELDRFVPITGGGTGKLRATLAPLERKG